MNGLESARLLTSPIWETDEEKPSPGKVVRVLNWTGITMANSENPRGFSFNPAVITLFLMILSLVAGGGWYLGYQARQLEELRQSVIEAKQKAEHAETLGTYAAAGTDEQNGHKPEKKTK
jgi:hypothetical protein